MYISDLFIVFFFFFDSFFCTSSFSLFRSKKEIDDNVNRNTFKLNDTLFECVFFYLFLFSYFAVSSICEIVYFHPDIDECFDADCRNINWVYL